MSALFMSLLRGALPYLIAASGGFMVAWGIQALRLTAAEQEFVEYKLTQIQAIQDAKDLADFNRQKAGEMYAAQTKELNAAMVEGATLRRCIAAGKCGGVSKLSADSRTGLQTPAGLDAVGENAISTAGVDEALRECALTTFQINSLQADIEAQPGYKE